MRDIIASLWKTAMVAAAFWPMHASAQATSGSVTSDPSFIIGGFNNSRGGFFSFPSGNYLDQARASLAANFTGASFTSFDTITPQTLAEVDLLMLSVGTSNGTAITPLSATEQSVLFDFVQGGGCAILFPDNSSFSSGAPVANESLIDPFGMDIAGTLGGRITAAVSTPAASPITNGPFGTISTFSQNYPGGLINLGPYAISLASNPLGNALAVIESGAIQTGSGRVIVFTDINSFGDTDAAGFFPENEALFLNTINACKVPVDTTPPDISVTQTPLANLAGWNNTDVTVSFTATDTGSTPTCTINSATLTTEEAGQIISTTCSDAANNSATASHTVNIDKTAPMLTMPDLASNYTVGSSVLISYAAVESLSQLASVSATLDDIPVSSGSTVLLSQLGNHIFTLTATDQAGNIETQAMQFTVSYAFSGFLPPLTADSRTTFRLGSVIPVKFELFDTNGEAVSTAVAHLSIQQLNNGEPVGDPIDVAPTSGADSGNLFRYSGGHYMYNLSTKPFSAGSWRIQAALDDGTMRTIDIGLTTR